MPRRYQNGTLELTATASGPTWYIRFTLPTGKRPRLRIGLKSQFPTKAKASRAAQPLRETFNSSPESLFTTTHTFADVIARYEQEEMPARFSTSKGYRKLHRLYIGPRWGTMQIDQVEPLAVRAWLNGLKCTKSEAPLSSRSKGHIHTQMKNLFRHAQLWKWTTAQLNPLSLFSIAGATKRTRKPRVISPAQFRALLEYFHSTAGDEVSFGVKESVTSGVNNALRMQVLIVTGFCLGLGASEIFGLKWGDVIHCQSVVHVQRGIVEGRVGEVKTERRNAPLPLAPFVAEIFARWRQASPHNFDEDWIFASPYKGGRKPLDPNNLQTHVLVPAGAAIGLDFNLGWHTLRHSYKSLLDRISSDATLKRDLMRHADVHTTMQVYGEVEMDRLREVNALAVTLATTE
jgi:integrase